MEVLSISGKLIGADCYYRLKKEGRDTRQLDSVIFWRRLLPTATSVANLTVLSKRFHGSALRSLTGHPLLCAASRIDAHILPEYTFAGRNAFSCGGEADTESIVEHITRRLKPDPLIKKTKGGLGFVPNTP